MSRRRGRSWWTALLLGGAVALVLELWRPDVWRIGSTPRFVATVVLVVVMGLWVWGRGAFGPLSSRPPQRREDPSD